MRLKWNSSLQGLITRKHMLVALAIVLAPTLVHAQTPAGTFDASVGSGGRVTIDFGAAAVAVQPDGKLVAAGTVVLDWLAEILDNAHRLALLRG